MNQKINFTEVGNKNNLTPTDSGNGSNPLLVTAFLSDINQRKDTNINVYIKNGSKLLKTPINKILYIDSALYDRFDTKSYPKTTIIPIEKNDIYLYQYQDKIKHMDTITRNKSKDTYEYMFLMCNKTEFIRAAIKKTKKKYDQYIWVDFGIRHIFENDREFYESFLSFKNKYKKVRIGSIWNLKNHYNFIYTQVAWYFAGGVFGGPPDKLIKFADKTKKECLIVIESFEKILWEVNIWYMVYLKNKDLFLPYQCDHNVSLIKNY